MQPKLTALTIASLTSLAGAARAEEPELHYTLELSSVTSYVVRGDAMSSDLMRPNIQPYAEVQLSAMGPGTLTVGVWTSSALAESTLAPEIDPYFGYSVPLGKLTLEASYTVYLMPEAPQLDSMHEFMFQASTNLDAPVQFYLGVGVDPVRTEGFYAFGGATTAFDVGPVAMEASLNVGGSEYSALAASLQDVTLAARATYAFEGSGVYLAASAATAWSGRSERFLPYAGLAVGVHR